MQEIREKSYKVYRKQSKMTEIRSFFINILNVNGLNAGRKTEIDRMY